ncbi:Cytochrome P450 4d2 [Boothiomyces macroporosus]|uniref:Cytochrome P450 4d2 n=1 Tax=Boothiomyces macroporosus TaxID=261099 RepID=A0AAD5UMC1_9FUNG|nr:Cytochrome P450 4d2 [Boothiomyces macroporosus]
MSSIIITISNTIASKPNAVLVANSMVISIIAYYLLARKPKSAVPGPKNYPIIGDPDQYKYVFKFKMYNYMGKNILKYGRIFRFLGLMGDSVVVADAKEAKRLFTDTDTFVKGDGVRQKMIGLLDYALFVLPTGDLWKKHRGKVAFGKNMKAVESFDENSSGEWHDLESMTNDVFMLVVNYLYKRFAMPIFLHKALGADVTSPKVAKAKSNVYSFLKELADERLEKIRSNEDGQESWDMDVLHSYLENVFKEAQRLHTVVPAVSRIAAVDTTVGGYSFKAGQKFMIFAHGIHRDPEYHKHPFIFNPDRFNNPIVPGSFIPFSDGPHM